MSLNFQQVHEQVKQMGENAPLREQKLQEIRATARQLLTHYANDLDHLRAKVTRALRSDPTLRCALPVNEPLTAHFSSPPPPLPLTLLAADGSQINPDRHDPVQYCLINVGTIQMSWGTAQPPLPNIQSKLLYDQDIYDLTENMVALRRDLAERQVLAELAAQAIAAQPETPVVSFTDGPVELWGAKDEQGDSEFQKSLDTYLESLTRLEELSAINAGYVDKPGADLVLRLLEVAVTAEDQMDNLRQYRPLRGVTDTDLFRDWLAPGERSAVFAMQSKSAEKYRRGLALHFFYLNVGNEHADWLARVEIPAWVASAPQKLETIQAVLIDQCKILGAKPYPYLLHRAHEAAVVTLIEKEQLTQMILIEMRRRGIATGEGSYKQAAKDAGGRTRFGA